MTIPKLLNLIPLASLAAILLIVGYKLAKPQLFKEMYQKGRAQFIPFIVTILGIVFTDLLIGIALGLVVAIFHLLWNNYKMPYHFEGEDYKEGDKVQIRLSEHVSFLNKAGIQRTLDQLPDNSEVVIDASKTAYIHPDVIEIIEDFQQHAKTKDIKVTFLQQDPSKSYDPVSHFQTMVVTNQPNKGRNA